MGRGKERPARAFLEPKAMTAPQFSGRLEDLREFKRSWEEYERVHYPKEPEEVLVKTAWPIGDDRVFLYYWKVCRLLISTL